MINFRFHLISLVAVFLALAIGILVGTTVLDRAIVDTLRNQIEVAENNSIQRRIENDRLTDELNQQNSQSVSLAGHAVRGYLSGQNIYVFTIGNVSDTARVEILELASVADARKSGVIRFQNEFITEEKNQIAEEITALENVPVVAGEEDADKQIIKTLKFSLNIIAGAPNELPIDANAVVQNLANNNVFTFEERIEPTEPILPTSFIVLIERSIFEDELAVDFIQSLFADYPMTIGLEGNLDSKVSRNRAIDLIGDQKDQISVVDNIETPNGRTSLIIAHAQNIAGQRQIFGVSDRAQSPAPILLGQ